MRKQISAVLEEATNARLHSTLHFVLLKQPYAIAYKFGTLIPDYLSLFFSFYKILAQQAKVGPQLSSPPQHHRSSLSKNITTQNIHD